MLGVDMATGDALPLRGSKRAPQRALRRRSSWDEGGLKWHVNYAQILWITL